MISLASWSSVCQRRPTGGGGRRRSFGPLPAAHVETIYYSSQLLSHFISDILDLSRLEAGAMELKRVKLNLKDIVNSCNELMGAKAEESSNEMVYAWWRGPRERLHRGAGGTRRRYSGSAAESNRR